jgi:hypothetical protein
MDTLALMWLTARVTCCSTKPLLLERRHRACAITREALFELLDGTWILYGTGEARGPNVREALLSFIRNEKRVRG